MLTREVGCTHRLVFLVTNTRTYTRREVLAPPSSYRTRHIRFLETPVLSASFPPSFRSYFLAVIDNFSPFIVARKPSILHPRPGSRDGPFSRSARELWRSLMSSCLSIYHVAVFYAVPQDHSTEISTPSSLR